jgi:hypothetical protein
VPPFGDSPFQAEYDAGWLESLAGLEALESVGGLKITGLSATTLEPLANLGALTDDGLLYIMSNPGLQDLSGLDALVSTGGLNVVENPQLVRLRGSGFRTRVRCLLRAALFRATCCGPGNSSGCSLSAASSSCSSRSGSLAGLAALPVLACSRRAAGGSRALQ